MLYDYWHRRIFGSRWVFREDYEGFTTSDSPLSNGWSHAVGPENNHISYEDMDLYGFATSWGWNTVFQWNNDTTGINRYDYDFGKKIRPDRIEIVVCPASQDIGDSGTIGFYNSDLPGNIVSIVTAIKDATSATNNIYLGSTDTGITNPTQRAWRMILDQFDWPGETFRIRIYETFPGTATPDSLEYSEAGRSFQNAGLQYFDRIRVSCDANDNTGFSTLEYVKIEGKIIH